LYHAKGKRFEVLSRYGTIVDRIPMDDDRISGSGCQPAKPEKVLRDDKKQKTHSSSVKAY
jgi:hypothetical protein